MGETQAQTERLRWVFPLLHRDAAPGRDNAQGAPNAAALCHHAPYHRAPCQLCHRALRRRAWVLRALAVLCVVVALSSAAAITTLVVRLLLPLALTLAALSSWRRAKRILASTRTAPEPLSTSERTSEPTSERTLELDEDGFRLTSIGNGARRLMPSLGPIGVTLISSRRRDRLVAAITSSEGTFYVATDLDAAHRREYSEMLVRSHAVASDECGLDAIGPDGEPMCLAPSRFAELLERLRALYPGCMDRFLLSDVSGAPVTLDGAELVVRSMSFDLAAPLSWRPLLFQETFGSAIAIYQGTWVRQGNSEIVLVSLLPSVSFVDAASYEEPAGHVDLDRAALRDLRLMQAAPEDPPPQEQRVAIDRLFMLPLRGALDRAPRASSEPLPLHP